MLRATRIVPILVVLAFLAGLGLTAPIVAQPAHHELQIQTAAPYAALQSAAAPAASDVVYLTKTGKCYHRDGCRCLAKSKIKTTRGEAEKRGFRACKICKP